MPSPKFHRLRPPLNWLARWPLGILSLLSALALALTLFRSVTIEKPPDWLFVADNGGIAIAHGANLLYQRPGAPAIEFTRPRAPFFNRLRGFSLRPNRIEFFTTGPAVTYVIPLWIPAVLFALPAALAWRAHLSRKRLGPSSCPTCGYDLRGLASTAACPECGAVRAPEPPP